MEASSKKLKWFVQRFAHGLLEAALTMLTQALKQGYLRIMTALYRYTVILNMHYLLDQPTMTHRKQEIQCTQEVQCTVVTCYYLVNKTTIESAEDHRMRSLFSKDTLLKLYNDKEINT